MNGLYREDPGLLTELADLALRQREPQQALDWLGRLDLRRSAVWTRALLLCAAGGDQRGAACAVHPVSAGAWPQR